MVGESGLAASPRALALQANRIVFALRARGGSNPHFPLSVHKKREAHSFKCTSSQNNQGEALHFIRSQNGISSIPQELHIISPQGLYIIKPQKYTLARDDIQGRLCRP